MSETGSLPVSESEPVQRAKVAARKLAALAMPLSVLGESGTGRMTLAKELVGIRQAALGAPACEPILGQLDASNPTVTEASWPGSGPPLCPLVIGIETMEERLSCCWPRSSTRRSWRPSSSARRRRGTQTGYAAWFPSWPSW